MSVALAGRLVARYKARMGDTLDDKALGALLGGAVGDAVGAPFEGLWGHSIPERDELLAHFHEYEGYPLGQYTDDTQLTLATVEAIVETGDIDLQAIATRIAALWEHDSVIGPGGACTRAALTFLETRDWTSCGAPVGQAGNGTAMRTAPLGLLFAKNADALPAVVGAISRITHQDPRSLAGGIAVAEAARLFAFEKPLDADAFCAKVADAMAVADAGFAQLVRGLPERLREPFDAAFAKIAAAGASRAEFDAPIITPFVVPTVLAALFCALKHADDWGEAVAEAVKLGGDVDTLGAIVGALMGVRLGASAIPDRLAANVVDAERIRVLAGRYAVVCRGE